ncbi:unnamed protein product [Symbiodinium necroappetens]|uniref:Fibronectin type-III domain-containing protein n=1 Tax=Symbiodinium necroappetens TaxID=1628268 RepID=A0A813B3Q7_9DINO|nr:unnamed protein product [Symbiodinium necroappetens]
MLSENATTIIATIPADPPENLTVSNETAYTFLLEFDAGEPYVGQLECAKDCYFTGWAVEVRENWTDGNFSNETNYTELNYSLWVPRDECKNEAAFPRNRMRCVVPRLRKHSIYDAKVRETCYDGYTELLDSDFSSELPDRQILVLMGWHVASGTGAAQESLSGHPCWGADAADSWASALTPQRCCVNPPFGDARCWMNGLDFDLCCTRWLHPRTPEPVHQRLKEDLTNCMQGAAPDAQPSTECRMSAYAAIEGSPLGRLLWCAIETAHCSRVFDVFIGSGCSAATAAAAMSARRASPRPVPVVIGFEDPEPQRAQKSHAALARWRARRLPVGGIGKQQLQQLRAASLRLRSWVEEKGGEEAFVGLLAGPMRPRNSSCSECLSQWALDCPERCVYSFGAIEAACEALRGVDLVFLDSDGSAADGWLVEWLQVERACAPRLVLLLNLSLPNHGAWIKERLLTLGYTEVWRDGLSFFNNGILRRAPCADVVTLPRLNVVEFMDSRRLIAELRENALFSNRGIRYPEEEDIEGSGTYATGHCQTKYEISSFTEAQKTAATDATSTGPSGSSLEAGLEKTHPGCFILRDVMFNSNSWSMWRLPTAREPAVADDVDPVRAALKHTGVLELPCRRRGPALLCSRCRNLASSHAPFLGHPVFESRLGSSTPVHAMTSKQRSAMMTLVSPASLLQEEILCSCYAFLGKDGVADFIFVEQHLCWGRGIWFAVKSEDVQFRAWAVEAETLVPVAATSPFGLVSLGQGPYSFSLAWSAGDPKDCLYQKWLVEIKDDNYTGDVWREAIECGREARDVTSCTITRLHEGYLGEEAHLRSNTEYEVRVKEFCQTYTSIYDPWGGSRERAEYLDSPIHYLPADQLPRTLAPVPTLTPLNFKVNETDHQSFRLSWEAQISNDCRFRNWTVEIRLVIHCIAGVGYTNCTAVEDQPWEVPGTCVIEDRSVTSCKVHDVKSYSFYEVKMRERCSDATAESADATLIAEVWPFLSDAPDNMTVTSPEPFTLNVKWDPGDPQECVFSHWDVQVQGRRVGDLDDTFSRESVTDKWYGMIWDLEGNASFLNWSTTIDSCRLVGQRDVAECNITGLISNALYDVRIAERCVDERADSPWLVERLQATIPAWALMPLGPNVSNVTTTTMDLEWAASEPRDCLFSSWKVEVKPTAITDDDWIPVPECSLPDRDATSCQIVGLQSYTSYDIRIQETCIHDTSNSPYLLEENSFTTLVGSVVYVGTNPLTNSKAIFFGSRGLNACAYHTKCCADEFSLCYSSQEVDVIRTDLPDAGWGQDLYLSCVADTVAQDDMKRIVARPPAKLEAVDRTANSIDLVWLPYGSGGYMSDCYCSEWNIFVRRQGTTEWLLSPDCRNMPFSQSSCTVKNLEDNWLAPNTVYEIRVRQTCSFDRLSSPYKEIQVPTLPGCVLRAAAMKQRLDGFFSFIFDGGRFDGDGTGCWRRGGRARCAKNFPYMCASPDSCAKVDSLQAGGVRAGLSAVSGSSGWASCRYWACDRFTPAACLRVHPVQGEADHCCMAEPCGSRNGGRHRRDLPIAVLADGRLAGL